MEGRGIVQVLEAAENLVAENLNNPFGWCSADVVGF